MFVRFGKILVVFSLAATLGVHWALLQTVAWTTMLADNLESNSFHEAVTKTFDGKHLCPLCKAIAAGKKSEQKTQISFQSQKLECPLPKENAALMAPSRFELLSAENTFAESSFPEPRLEPPRGFFI